MTDSILVVGATGNFGRRVVAKAVRLGLWCGIRPGPADSTLAPAWSSAN
ncbi:hypothetical protein [Cryobacterium arcticum]|nr:hypothetical protein [Cryobacterium arcticum]